jgi:hypothetical protein
MDFRSKLGSLLSLLICATLGLLTSGCPLLQQESVSSESSTGSISGKVAVDGQANLGGIVVTAELTDGVKSVGVQRMLAAKSQAVMPVAGQATAKSVAGQATTDAAGTYTLTGLEAGTYTLNAASSDGVLKGLATSVYVAVGSTTSAPTLKLGPTGEIDGRVLLDDSSSSLGIAVFIAGSSFNAMTDANGYFAMSLVPAGVGYTLVASKVGYDSFVTNASVEVNKITTLATITLKKPTPVPVTGSLSGSASLSDGPPDAGIFVYLLNTTWVTVTDDAGSFCISGVAPGQYTVIASKAGYESASFAGVQVSAGSTFVMSVELGLTAIQNTVSSPTFSPSTGTYSSNQQVTIYDATPGVIVYYTIDGSTPTTSSAVFTGPILVAGDGTITTIKAIAVKVGMTTSSVSQSTYSIIFTAASPPMLIPGAGTFSSDQQVTIYTATPGAILYYTTDGTPPTTTSQVYSGPISVYGNGTVLTISAKAYNDGMAPSSISKGTYTILYPITPPKVLSIQLSLPSDTYYQPKTISISTTPPGASVRYTTDGSNPSATNGAFYLGPIALTSPHTVLKAVAYEPGWSDSPIVTGTYTQQVAAPRLSRPSGDEWVVATPDPITLVCETPSASIRYTTDGSEPTSSHGTLYSGPFTGMSGVFKAIAYLSGWADSTIASAQWVFYVYPPDAFIEKVQATFPGDKVVELLYVTLSPSITPGAKVAAIFDSGVGENRYEWSDGQRILVNPGQTLYYTAWVHGWTSIVKTVANPAQ